MQFTTMNITDAPANVVAPKSPYAPVIAAVVDTAPDEMVTVAVDEGMTIRGAKTAIGRLAAQTGIEIEQYDVDGIIYVSLVREAVEVE